MSKLCDLLEAELLARANTWAAWSIDHTNHTYRKRTDAERDECIAGERKQLVSMLFRLIDETPVFESYDED